jgi:SAM-dependent methyltransferase
LRNREPIACALRGQLGRVATVLEIASGTGEHAVHFSAAEPGWTWHPTDQSVEAVRSIEAYRIDAGLPNLMPARVLDTTSEWTAPAVNAVVCINMIHIAPWAAAEGLFRGAARCLAPGGKLVLYGPFRFGGRFTAPSNAAFDRQLRSRESTWGVRDLEDLQALAQAGELSSCRSVEMPANNHLLVFARN